MKCILTLLICFLLFETSIAQKKRYGTHSSEIIFSIAEQNGMGSFHKNNLRFSPVFNWQSYSNKDWGKHFGMFYGLSVRNIGFITKNANEDSLIKYRSYNLGIPIGFKVGTIEKTFLYGGYELELPFNFKQKTFVNEKKVDKFSVWFSNRTNPLLHSIFVGIQFKRGINLKVKYYLNNFFNKNYVESHNGINYYLYKDTDVHIMYVSLSINTFKKSKRKKLKEPAARVAQL